MKCSFCGGEIILGQGKMAVQADGTVLYFCKPKCEKNARIRQPQNVAWTAAAKKLKAEAKGTKGAVTTKATKEAIQRRK